MARTGGLFGGAVTAAFAVALLAATASCAAQEARLTIAQSNGVTYVRDTGVPVEDDVRYEGRLFLGDDGCLYLALEGESIDLRAVVPQGVDVKQDSLVTDDGGIYRFGDTIQFTRSYGDYYENGIAGFDPCDTSLELFGVSRPR